MTNPQNFLVTYGLHNFVTHTRKHRKNIFLIKGGEPQKMVDHARNLIKNSFGDTTNIQVV